MGATWGKAIHGGMVLSSRSVVLSDKSCIVEREEEFQLGNSQEDRNQEHSSTDITQEDSQTRTLS